MKKLALLSLLFLFCSCQSSYYKVMELVGQEKRHLLVKKVKNLLTKQEDNSQEFTDVLERIRSEYKFDGGELETTYDSLKSDYENCKKRHLDLQTRIADVDEIAEDLFEEWEDEADEISKASLRRSSEKSLAQSKSKFTALSKAMHKAESKVPPVINNLKDYTLFLKHNLNAKAIGGLNAEMKEIEDDIAILIKDVQSSIKEAESFIDDFNSGE